MRIAWRKKEPASYPRDREEEKGREGQKGCLDMNDG
jgi:hypothetical protein